MREPKNQMLGTMEPPPLMQLSVNFYNVVKCENSTCCYTFLWCTSVIYHILLYIETSDPGGWGEGCFHHVYGGDTYALRLNFTIQDKDPTHLTLKRCQE